MPKMSLGSKVLQNMDLVDATRAAASICAYVGSCDAKTESGRGRIERRRREALAELTGRSSLSAVVAALPACSREDAVGSHVVVMVF